MVECDNPSTASNPSRTNNGCPDGGPSRTSSLHQTIAKCRQTSCIKGNASPGWSAKTCTVVRICRLVSVLIPLPQHHTAYIYHQ